MSSTVKTREIYIQDPIQKSFLKLPAFQESEEWESEIIVTDKLPHSTSIDLITFDSLKKKFHWMSAAPSSEENSPDEAEIACLSDTPTSPFSKIPLLLELYLHFIRVIEALISDSSQRRDLLLSSSLWSLICFNILKEFPVDRDFSNRKLDRCRLKLAIDIEKQVMTYARAGEMILRSAKDLSTHLRTKTIEQIQSLFFFNAHLKSLIEITASSDRQSSHSKNIMPPALMLITLFFYSPTREIRKARIRCPSLTQTQATASTRAMSVLDNLRMAALCTKKGESGTPTLYQLLTSFPKIDRNREWRTAYELFAAAHDLNRENPKFPTLLIFNIPVNQHTLSLTYESFYPEIREALVMADLSVLYKMDQWLELSTNWKPSKAAYRSLQKIKIYYLTFLAGENRYLHEIEDWKAFITDLSLFKAGLFEEASFVSGELYDFHNLALKAFILLYCSKYSGMAPDETELDDQACYGLTVQALFSALDNYNLIGCKSANERFFLTEGLTQIFEAFIYQTLPAEEQEAMKQHFLSFLLGRITALDFMALPMQFHNQYAVYGSAMGPSLLDTGTPKCGTLESDPGIGLGLFKGQNSNYFAPNLYTAIHQTFASKMQAHQKSLNSRLVKALESSTSTPVLHRSKSDYKISEVTEAAAKCMGSGKETIKTPRRDPEDPSYGSYY